MSQMTLRLENNNLSTSGFLQKDRISNKLWIPEQNLLFVPWEYLSVISTLVFYKSECKFSK